MSDIILFGAGASFGSEHSVRVPPLGEQLLYELAAFAPQTWGALPPPWLVQFRADFESAMSEFINAGHFAAPLQWDMAEFFYRGFSATPESAYAELLNGLGDRLPELLFVTLNYESMLFQACHHAGIDIKNLSVCLPHGSSILMCEVVKGTAGGVTFKGKVSNSGNVRPFRSEAEFLQQKTTNVFPPVMSYYEPNKFTVSGANFIKSQREKFLTAVASANSITIVGARVHTSDAHIWEPLSKTKATILYVSGTTGGEEYRQWADQEGREGDVVLESYFRESLGEILEFIA